MFGDELIKKFSKDGSKEKTSTDCSANVLNIENDDARKTSEPAYDKLKRK